MKHASFLGSAALLAALAGVFACSSESGSKSSGAGAGGVAGAGGAPGGSGGLAGAASGGAAGQAGAPGSGGSGAASSAGAGGSNAAGGSGGTSGSGPVCPLSSSDFPCTVCEKKNCCAELTAFGAAPDLAAFSSCVESCTSTTCPSSCESKYPAAGAAFETMRSCEASQCPASCDETGAGQNDALRNWCKTAVAASCGGGVAQSSCEDGAVQNGKYYATSDCAPEYWDALACGATKPAACESFGATIDPSCQKPLDDCMNKTTSCPWSPNPDGSCEKLCTGWTAKCSPVSGSSSLACECTSGPHLGKTFKVTGACGSNTVLDAMDQQCAP